MHWQVKKMQGRKKLEVYYLDPKKHQVEMVGCKLVNKLNRAKKVHEEGVKDVTGWVECEKVKARLSYRHLSVDNLERLFYNPIRDVHWRRESDDNEFAWDDSKYDTLVTRGKQVYVLEERS